MTTPPRATDDGPDGALAEWREALSQACEAVVWLLEHWGEDEDPGPGIRTDLGRWQAALRCRADGDSGEG